VIATKFPSYFVRHPAKAAWLIHQYRAAYELAGTPYSDFRHAEEDVAVRERLVALDTMALGECVRLFANSQNTANRVLRYNGVAARALYHPPRLADRLRPGPAQSYVLSVGRLERIKRVDLAIRAMAFAAPEVSLVVAGQGLERQALETLSTSLGLQHRVRFLGEVDDDAIVEWYAGSLGVVYPPYDEDYGYVTIEAFLAHKPVVTTTDAGGPNEFVTDDVNGFVSPPEPEALGAAITRLHANRARAAAMGGAGYDRARTITWAGVVEALVGERG